MKKKKLTEIMMVRMDECMYNALFKQSVKSGDSMAKLVRNSVDFFLKNEKQNKRSKSQ